MEFSRWRRWIWPLHRSELKRFLPLLVIYALVCFNYSLLRGVKDALIITAPSSGAEAIPFIKVWAILPMALLATFVFTRLSNRFGRDRTFYIMITGFLAFFALFGFVLYPLQDFLHPHGLADTMQAALPKGLNGLVAMIRNWTFTLFYVVSELWGTMVMTVLFWGFANQVTNVNDAKRFYAIYGLGANVASIFAGWASASLSSGWIASKLSHTTDPWGVSVMLITGVLLVIGALAILIYRWYCRSVIDPEHAREGRSKPKIKLGLRESFAYLAKSPYLICIAIVVLAYNISLNMIEVVWKDQLKLLCPNPADYNAYMGRVVAMMGVLSTFMAVFVTGASMRRMGWTFSALITPVIMCVTGIAFFSLLLMHNSDWGSAIGLFGMTPLALGVFLGAVQNCFARASKYTVFDATKELSFVPLSQESKLKGKSAIDGVGSRLGKSGGSLLHQGFLMIFGSISLSTPYIAVLLFIVVGAWIAAVKSLGHKFHAISEPQPPALDTGTDPQPVAT
ncbi:MAG: MFS transporter [Chlamydiia bacterium]|nr:MFS transporter [Chlamydiia bacterium]MCP5492383.1 MFS transporter [Chlamydiales bacterium]